MFRRILLWFCGTLLFSLIGFVLTSYIVSSRAPAREPMMRRMSTFQLNEGIRVYENGGRQGLREFVERLDAAFPASHYFLDAAGRDLLTGEDRSNTLSHAANRSEEHT